MSTMPPSNAATSPLHFVARTTTRLPSPWARISGGGGGGTSPAAPSALMAGAGAGWSAGAPVTCDNGKEQMEWGHAYIRYTSPAVSLGPYQLGPFCAPQSAALQPRSSPARSSPSSPSPPQSPSPAVPPRLSHLASIQLCLRAAHHVHARPRVGRQLAARQLRPAAAAPRHEARDAVALQRAALRAAGVRAHG